MDDKAWNDYLTGVNTGVSYNHWSSIGAEHAYKPPPAPKFVPISPDTRNSVHSHVLTGSLPPQEIAAPQEPQHVSGWDRWFWNLSDTLSDWFLNSQIAVVESTAWLAVVILTTIAGAVAGLGFLPETLIWPVAASWATVWWHKVAIVFAGGLVGAVAPFFVLLFLPPLFWLVGKLVTIAVAGSAVVVAVLMLWKLAVFIFA